MTTAAPRTLPHVVSALSPRTSSATSLPLSGYDKRLMLFAGRSNPELAAKIANKLGLELGGVTLKTFSNGEVYCRYEESIRGADVFIVQPTCGNPATGITANDALMELLIMIDAAVGASAHRVIAVTPWFGYSPPGQEVGAARADLQPASSPTCSRPRARTACSRWTSTPARCRASSPSPWTT